MKILAIETSGEEGSVALLAGDSLLEFPLIGLARHSERLLPTVMQLLAEAGLTLGQLDALAFGAGPGAFTGLRLACGVVQGLALGTGLPVVPVCSLQALALAGPPGPVLVAVDARMGEVYGAAYLHADGEPQEIEPPRCMPPEDLSLPTGGPWVGIGSGFIAYAQRMTPGLLNALAGVLGEAVPTAQAVARLAAIRVARGDTVTASQAAPLYVRDKVALTTVERLARGARG